MFKKFTIALAIFLCFTVLAFAGKSYSRGSSTSSGRSYSSGSSSSSRSYSRPSSSHTTTHSSPHISHSSTTTHSSTSKPSTSSSWSWRKPSSTTTTSRTIVRTQAPVQHHYHSPSYFPMFVPIPMPWHSTPVYSPRVVVQDGMEYHYVREFSPWRTILLVIIIGIVVLGVVRLVYYSEKK